MTKPYPTTWRRKFQNAFRGIWLGLRGGRTNSFYVHIPVAISTVILAWVLGVSKIEWAVLLLCIAVAIASELFNSSIERLAESITKDPNREIGDALDIASGAVLIVCLFVAAIGAIILGSAFFSR